MIPTAIKTNQFQHHYEKLLRNVKKHVDKNVKIKKSVSCNCTTTLHRIKDSFFLVSICEGNSTTKTFIIMWFIDCCMTMNEPNPILCCDNDATPNDYQNGHYMKVVMVVIAFVQTWMIVKKCSWMHGRFFVVHA